MDKLEMQAPAKINLTLDVLGKDEGTGYHLIQTIYQRVSLFDDLEFEKRDEGGLTIQSTKRLPEDNTLQKAYDIFCKHVSKDLSVHINLRKNIPSGAGLGGASSDAATVLASLNHLFSFDLSRETLMELGKEIGMDVPFFVSNYATALGTHFGERILSLPSFPSMPVLILYPKVKSSTERAYKSLDLDQVSQFRHKTDMFCDRLRRGGADASSFIPLMHNDFEPLMFKKNKVLSELKEKIISEGIANVMLTGSGSSLIAFGPVSLLRNIRELYDKQYLVFVVNTY
jgi:4-diphosphocytidyl-2-C-methyl-D-erythritol kinase